MKKIKILSIAVIIAFTMTGCNNKKGEINSTDNPILLKDIISAETQKIIFARTSTSIGVVADDKVKFYFISNAGWSEGEDWEFTLPNGYKNVFARTSTSIGVVADNKVKFYFISNDGWSEGEDWEFNF